MKSSMPLALLFFCFAFAWDPAAATGDEQHARPTARVPHGSAPTIDGGVEDDEWTDGLTLRTFGDTWATDMMSGNRDAVYDPTDLDVEIRMKHDGETLYILAIVRDNLIYAVDTDQWQPPAGKHREPPYWKTEPGSGDIFGGAHWGWWGDCVEVAIVANMDADIPKLPTCGAADPDAPGQAWKIQGNISYARIMTDQSMAGWVENDHIRWQGKLTKDPRGYIQEWAIDFDPVLDTGGQPYSPEDSDPMGFQLLVMDLDKKEAGEGWSNIRHQAVWSYAADEGDKRLRENWGRLVLLPAEEDETTPE
ncbi:MAG: hypothetical protein ACOCUY_01930 [Verrucomicrobiota bacterium]